LTVICVDLIVLIHDKMFGITLLIESQ
jgi:hypothetical protein